MSSFGVTPSHASLCNEEDDRIQSRQNIKSVTARYEDEGAEKFPIWFGNLFLT
jgi:hypothetical protein